MRSSSSFSSAPLTVAEGGTTSADTTCHCQGYVWPTCEVRDILWQDAHADLAAALCHAVRQEDLAAKHLHTAMQTIMLAHATYLLTTQQPSFKGTCSMQPLLCEPAAAPDTKAQWPTADIHYSTLC